jgi:hypothetical protein
MENESIILSQDSLIQAADKLVDGAKRLAREDKTEEDLKIGFEKTLEPLCQSLGIRSEPKYEKTIYQGGRLDAVHGKVILEYKKPLAFRSPKAIAHAFSQLVQYIQEETIERKDTLFLFDPRYVGVGFDGEQIFFVQYKGDKTEAKIELEEKDFLLAGPYPFDAQSSRTLLTFLRSLSRKLLTAENLAETFGPKSEIARTAAFAFLDAIENWGGERTDVFFNEWKRLFGIVYGEQFDFSMEEKGIFPEYYGVDEKTDFQKLLFSIHTYFALLMKLIAAELITLRERTFASSFSTQILYSSGDNFKEILSDLENGGVYARRGIRNFLEGDFFRWYFYALSPRLEEAIKEMARGLSEFEPATPVIATEFTRDLLKKLYQYLVPQEVRHRLGEYYTPDWLAELVLDETGYDGNTLKRLLDPACGSGTFLVLAIHRAKEYGRRHKEPPLETAKRIISNIWGFDLNPLAVIAARTNYLFALGDLVNELSNVEIPIYLADSVLWPSKTGQIKLNFAGGKNLEVQTSIGQFHVPYIWIENDGFLMSKAAPMVEEMARQGYSGDEALEKFRKEGLVFPPHERVVQFFYEEILNLERQGKNGIWTRFLKNAFAPMMAGWFDFVIGNPPWIRWGYLSQEYRKATLPLWQEYGLFSLKGHAARLGGGEKDFSMLFTYAAIDHYLRKNSKLGFLITQEVFKSKGAGEGFRRFQLGDRDHFKILKAHDLVTVQPFEGAANKTAAIILKKGEKTAYPVSYTLWTRKKRVGKIPTDYPLEKALPFLQKKKLAASPIGAPAGSWQTIEKGREYLRAIEGKNHYPARRGASTEPYGVFWLEVKTVLSDGNLIVRNLAERGKRKIPPVEEKIESDLVFPAVRGADIERWKATPGIYILMSQDPDKSEPYTEAHMKNEWPRTYGYLLRFKDVLLSRGSNAIRELAERTAFYAMYGIGSYTVARYKVIWKRMAGDMVAAVVSQYKTPSGYKTIIPTDTTSLFAADNAAEAHYLCAVINSAPVREFIKSFSSAGRGFGAPSVMEHVGIPQFDPKNPLQQKLSELSKALHELKEKNQLREVEKMEKDVDRAIIKLFKIKD